MRLYHSFCLIDNSLCSLFHYECLKLFREFITQYIYRHKVHNNVFLSAVHESHGLRNTFHFCTVCQLKYCTITRFTATAHKCIATNLTHLQVKMKKQNWK